MDYQKFRPVTKPSCKQKESHRDNFAEHNYNYVNKSTKLSNMNTQNYLCSQTQNIQQPTSNSVNFHDELRSSQEQKENYPLFQQNENNTNNIIPEIKLSIIQQIIFHQMMKNTIIKIITKISKPKTSFLQY